MIEKLHTSPDVYRIRVVLPDNPLQYLNAYVIKGKTENLVIDTGFNRPECQDALCRGLEELGIEFRHTSLFLTHLHADHTGLVGLFAKEGCPIYMHPSTINTSSTLKTARPGRRPKIISCVKGCRRKKLKANFPTRPGPFRRIRTSRFNRRRWGRPAPGRL